MSNNFTMLQGIDLIARKQADQASGWWKRSAHDAKSEHDLNKLLQNAINGDAFAQQALSKLIELNLLDDDEREIITAELVAQPELTTQLLAKAPVTVQMEFQQAIQAQESNYHSVCSA